MRTLLFYFSLLSCALAANITLAWDDSLGAMSYRLHYGMSSGTYIHSQDTVENTLTLALAPGVYYFAVSATSPNGESSPSDEIAYLVQDILPATVSADGKGTVTVNPAIGNVPCPNGLILQRSDDLKTWTDMGRFPVPSSPLVIPDAIVPRRFYRLTIP